MFLKWQGAGKAMVAFMLGCFGLVVGIDNILDFNTNFQFMKHVMCMDTMQPWFSHTSALRHRAVFNASIYHVAYIGIIICEIATGLLYLFSSYHLIRSAWKNRQTTTGKMLFLIGSMLGLVVWYFGFCIVGGEYFSMWANTYNAYNKAYQLSIFILLATLFVCQKEHRL